MDITVFLAQLWGPVILAVGVGMFVSRGYYASIYRNLESSGLAGLTFGMFAMGLGIAQVLFHNIWDTFLAGFLSFLGWALLLKGAVYLIAPGFTDKAGNWVAAAKLVPFISILVLIAGVYLTWAGYFA